MVCAAAAMHTIRPLMIIRVPRRHLNFAVLLLAVGLHIASIAAARYLFSHAGDTPPAIPPLAIQLVPDARPSAQTEAPMAAMNARSTLPLSQKPATPATARKPPVPASKTDLAPMPAVNIPEPQPRQKTLPAPISATAVTTAESTMPGAAPAATIKTGVTIPASYAASNRKPDYPKLSQRFGEQGTTVLRVLVQADGSAGEVQIAKSSGHELLDAAARAALRSWRFNLATSEGKAIAEWYQISIPFTLQD